MSMIGSAVGVAAAGSIGLVSSQQSVMASYGDPPWWDRVGQQDLLHRWNGNTYDPNSVPVPGHWYQPNSNLPWIQPQPLMPASPPQYFPDPRTQEQIEAERAAQMQEFARFIEAARQAIPTQPVQAAPTAPAELEGKSTEDSFKPQRKLDLD